VSGARGALRAERKALLATRAELDRARISMSLRQIRAVVAPSPDTDRVARLKPTAAVLTGILGSIAGASRLGRWLRIASIGLTALRILRSWR
jgi:MFS superfamily sulfate permease-like transporter